jgi:hypothetical protein
MSNNHDMLDSFDDFLSEHEAATSGLSIEGAMTLFSYQSDLTMSETIALGEQVTYIAASLFADFWAANEELSLEDALESFCERMRFSPDFTGKLVNDLIEAADDEDADDEDISSDATEGTQDELEARVRIFLDKIFGNVPDSMKDYADLKIKLAPQLYGNGPWDRGVKPFDRHKHRFGHTLADQDDDRTERRKPSIYQSDAVTAAISESGDVDMLLSPRADYDRSGWLDKSINTDYDHAVPDGTAEKNLKGLKAAQHGYIVKLPHQAVAEAESYGTIHGGFGVRVHKVEGAFTHLAYAEKSHADQVAEHTGQLFGRLAVSQYQLEAPKPDEALYGRSALAVGLDKKQTPSARRAVREAVAFLERNNKAGTYDLKQQELQDRQAAESMRAAQRHVDSDATEHDLGRSELR